jgi:hypothetical protein
MRVVYGYYYIEGVYIIFKAYKVKLLQVFNTSQHNIDNVIIEKIVVVIGIG